MNDKLRGAVRSKTVWVNVFLALLSGIELAGAHFTTLWGPKAAAAVLLVGSLVNLALRAYTTSALEEKA